MSEQVKLIGDPKLDALLKEPSPEFDALVRSLPETYWARYDLGAMRLGWEFGRMHKDALERANMAKVQEAKLLSNEDVWAIARCAWRSDLPGWPSAQLEVIANLRDEGLAMSRAAVAIELESALGWK